MRNPRILLTAGCMLAAATALPASADEVVIATTGGLMRNSLEASMYKPFTEATGIEVVPVDIEVPDQWAKAEAMARSGKMEYDVVTSTGGDLIEKKDILHKIDCAALPNVVKNGLPGSCEPYGIVRTIGAQMIAYDTEVFPEGPKNWADFWNVEKFPGGRGLPDTGDRDWWLPAIALMADGVKPADLWPLDLDRAYKKLDEIRPHVAVWWKTGNQMQQIMRNKEVVMVIGYSGRALATVREGQPWAMVWEDTIRDAGIMSIMKDAPHLDAALKYVDFFYANSDGHPAFMRAVNYATSSQGGLAKLPPEEQVLYPTAPDNFAKMVQPDFEWIGKNRAQLRERWTRWISQ